MLTQDEAKKTRCCGPDDCGDAGRKCVASGCMAWRWHLKGAFFSVSWRSGSDGRYIDRPGKPIGTLQVDEDHWVTAYMPDDQKAIGYCGLAGHP